MILGLEEKELFCPGHRACAGCGASLTLRHLLKAAGENTIICHATGCMEVVSTPYPQTAWKVPWIHVAFENAAAVASGVERALKKQGKKTNVIALGGDGGTFDIGFQALSGALERGHNFLYVCYDNGAYMNTGIQRSGATPRFASTTTSPAGKKIHGKAEFSKPMPLIVAAHGAYSATANIAFPLDFAKKIKKGLEFNGPAYIQIMAPCTPGWGISDDSTIKVAKLAFETKVTPLFEIENGVLTFTKKPLKDVPVSEYLKLQTRFKHLNEEEIKIVQDNISENYSKLLKLEETKVKI